MDEKKIMADDKLEAELKALRCKEKTFTILMFGSFAAFLVFAFMGVVPMIVIGLVLFVVFMCNSVRTQIKVQDLLNENVINVVLKEALGADVEYKPWEKIIPDKTMLPFPYCDENGSQHIKAVYNGMNIELGNITFFNKEEYQDQDGTSTKSVPQFKGQWLICDFGKELSGEVRLSANTKNLRKKNKNNNIEMENEEFNKRFLVIAGNPEEAYYILTPHKMEYILSMADKSGGEVYMSFLRDGKLHVAVQTGRDFFELGKNNANVEELRQKFLGELRWFTDIIDTLCMENTIYKKETNA